MAVVLICKVRCIATHIVVSSAHMSSSCMQGYAIVPEDDEVALKEAVYSRGPLAVSIDAAHPSFRFYSHGEVLHCEPIPLINTSPTRVCITNRKLPLLMQRTPPSDTTHMVRVCVASRPHC